MFSDVPADVHPGRAAHRVWGGAGAGQSGVCVPGAVGVRRQRQAERHLRQRVRREQVQEGAQRVRTRQGIHSHHGNMNNLTWKYFVLRINYVK